MKEQVFNSYLGRLTKTYQERDTPLPVKAIINKENTNGEVVFSAEKNQETRVGFSKNLYAVLEKFIDIKERKLWEFPRDEEVRTAIVLDSGANRGVFSAGVGEALDKKGLVECADNVIGVSTGAACGFGLVTGIAHKTASIYYEHNIDNGFIKWNRPFSGIANMDVVEDALRNATSGSKVCVENFIVGVTHRTTGESKFINIKDVEDPISLVMASVNIPILSNRSYVLIDNEPSIDGGISHPLPISHAVENLKATHVLAITPHPLNEVPELSYRAFRAISQGVLNGRLKEKIKGAHARRKQEIAYALDPQTRPKEFRDVKVALIYPEEISIGWLTRKSEALKKTYEESFRQTMTKLSIL